MEDIKEFCSNELEKVVRIIQPLKQQNMMLELENKHLKDRVSQLEKQMIELSCNYERLDSEMANVKKRKFESPGVAIRSLKKIEEDGDDINMAMYLVNTDTKHAAIVSNNNPLTTDNKVNEISHNSSNDNVVKKVAKVSEKEVAKVVGKETTKVLEKEAAKMAEKDDVKVPEEETNKVAEKETAKVPEEETSNVVEKETAKVPEKDTAKEADKVIENDQVVEEEETDKVPEKENDQVVEEDVDKVSEKENDQVAENESVKVPEKEAARVVEKEDVPDKNKTGNRTSPRKNSKSQHATDKSSDGADENNTSRKKRTRSSASSYSNRPNTRRKINEESTEGSIVRPFLVLSSDESDLEGSSDSDTNTEEKNKDQYEGVDIINFKIDNDMPMNLFIDEFLHNEWNIFSDVDNANYIRDKIENLMTYFALEDKYFDTFYTKLIYSTTSNDIKTFKMHELKLAWDLVKNDIGLICGLLAILLISRLENKYHPCHPRNVSKETLIKMLGVLFDNFDKTLLESEYRSLKGRIKMNDAPTRMPHMFLINAIALRWADASKKTFLESLQYVIDKCAKSMFTNFIDNNSFEMKKWKKMEAECIVDAILLSQPIKFHGYSFGQPLLNKLKTKKFDKLVEYGEKLFGKTDTTKTEPSFEKVKFNFLALVMIYGCGDIFKTVYDNFLTNGNITFKTITLEKLNEFNSRSRTKMDSVFGKKLRTCVIIKKSGYTTTYNRHYETTSFIAMIENKDDKWYYYKPTDATKENNNSKVLTMDYIMLYQCMDRLNLKN